MIAITKPSARESDANSFAQRRARILAAVDTAEAVLARGEGRVITRESMRDLAAEVKERGRANFEACDELMRRRGGEAAHLDDKIG